MTANRISLDVSNDNSTFTLEVEDTAVLSDVTSAVSDDPGDGSEGFFDRLPADWCYMKQDLTRYEYKLIIIRIFQIIWPKSKSNILLIFKLYRLNPLRPIDHKVQISFGPDCFDLGNLQMNEQTSLLDFYNKVLHHNHKVIFFIWFIRLNW